MAAVRRSLVPVVALLIAVLVAGPAHARIGEPASINLSVERLFGFSHTKVNDQIASSTYVTRTHSELALFVGSPASPYTAPRLALDIGIDHGITVGGSFGFILGSSSETATAGPITVGAASDGFNFIAAPRGGFALGLGEKGRLWLRGGFSYYRLSTKDTSRIVYSGLAFSVEPAFAYLLGDNFGVSLALVMDLPLTGSRHATLLSTGATNERDYSIRNIGAVIGFTFAL